MDKISYALGIVIGKNLVNSGFSNIDIKSFSKSVEEILKGEKPSISEEEANEIINDYFSDIQAKQFEGNLKAGQDFLNKNKTKEGVVVLPSGLQYEVLKAGDGEKPGPTDQVKCHYHGTLIDGTVFDSSVERGTPATFGVNQVIKGWTEALQLMPVGSKWRLFIPSDLAYGASGAGQSIEPNSALIFDVEILEII